MKSWHILQKLFYRAGYIESWGRGIQKICEACKNLGAELPEYIVHGEDIMVKFTALESAKVTEKQDEVEQKILDILKKIPDVTYVELSEKLNVSRKTISQKIKQLKEKGAIVRISSDKKGYWEITDFDK